MKRILIIQTAFLGDVVLATPLIEKLHAFYPEASIDFMLRKGNESLFKAHPLLNKVLVWDKGARKYINLWHLLLTVRKHRYDIVLNLQRFFSTGMFSILSKGRITVGFDKNPLSVFFHKKVQHLLEVNHKNPHEIERNLKLIEHLTDDSIVKPRLYPSPEDFHHVAQLKTQPYICIAPASVWFTKQFPIDMWVAFLMAINKKYMVYFVGSKADKAISEQIIGKCCNPLLTFKSLCGTLSLLESAALMKDATMNFVNDSAPLHLCSAMNAATTAIFCSTAPEFGFTPLSENSHIIEVSSTLPCRPCNNHGQTSCPEKHFKCAFAINVKEMASLI